MALFTNPALAFYSSDRALELGFDTIKSQALHWVFDGDPVGPWYEAALPGRAAFCMRDVSHQCFGAEMLGLHRQNVNMFAKFAAAISDARDWCSYWEIDKFDRPCPVDYQNDQDFWYNLPANFDVLDAMKRMYFASGDAFYLTDPRVQYFRAQTMEAYIARWDRDGDGIPDRKPDEGRRGLCTYDESEQAGQTLKVGTDLMALMIRAYQSDACLLTMLGFREQAKIYKRRAASLSETLNGFLYDEACGYASGIDMNGKPAFFTHEPLSALLYYGVIPLERAPRLLDHMEAHMDDTAIEGFSHFPEILWRYGRNEAALHALRRLMDPALPRKEYPEASFCAVGALCSGLMGLSFDAPARRVETHPALSGVSWARLLHIPFCGGELHFFCGDGESELENRTNVPVVWAHDRAEETLAPGETRRVRL